MLTEMVTVIILAQFLQTLLVRYPLRLTQSLNFRLHYSGKLGFTDTTDECSVQQKSFPNEKKPKSPDITSRLLKFLNVSAVCVFYVVMICSFLKINFFFWVQN